MAAGGGNQNDRLYAYRQKRNFGRTPEPPGGEAAKAQGIYVVHKHAATRLHYDFRLELEGVLKSWAVPKGPSLDPGEKRLAMHVEDHPVEYASFEGIIPKGAYGAGTVMIWDRGVWTYEGNPHAAYRKGALKFGLQGTKLLGGWALVRLKTDEEQDKESWLLVKEKDMAALEGDGEGILARLPKSAATGRTMEEIAAERNAVWTREGGGSAAASAEELAAAGAVAGKMPQSMEPQHATLVERPPVGAGWFHEIKHDGYRLLCRIGGGGANLFTRRGNDWTSQFPTLAKAVLGLPVEEAWIDGEAVILKADGTSSFQELQNVIDEKREGEITYFAFDLLYLNGYDLRQLPLEKRKGLLYRLIGAGRGNIRYGDHWEGEGAEFYEQACLMHAEGIVSKQRESKYYHGRSRSWLKAKCRNRQEFVIGGFTEPAGGRFGFGALLVGAHDRGGNLIYCGRVGTGFNERLLRELTPVLRGMEQDARPFINLPPKKPGQRLHWVRPALVAEVEYGEMTNDGILRHPSFLGLRKDKPAEEVRLEKPEPLPAVKEECGGSRETVPVADQGAFPREAPGRGSTTFAHIRFTNPDRILYADQGITKMKLARYYHRIHELMLPHLARRPLTLVRCPLGHHRDCFYQKHAHPGVSHLIKRVEILENGEVEQYMRVDDLQGLLSLVQMGVLEIHTWNSRAELLEYPDRIVFDLDPDEGLPWGELAEGALLLRDRLLDQGLENFIKTTGGKGFHVVVPLLPDHDWGGVRAFAKGVAEQLALAYPERFTPKMAKIRRNGRIFLDWMRNIRGATAVEVYSTRARSGAPASVPITWEELATGLVSAAFTIDNMEERLERLKRDPWEGYFAVRQSIPSGS